MLDLNDLRLFAKVAQLGGFTAAGRALGLPKSRLSRRIAALEEGLGVRLLQRSTRRLSLTDVGETFLRHCETMLAEAEAAEQAVAQARSEPSGLIRVTCPHILAQTMIAPLINSFLAAHPAVRIAMELTGPRPPHGAGRPDPPRHARPAPRRWPPCMDPGRCGGRPAIGAACAAAGQRRHVHPAPGRDRRARRRAAAGLHLPAGDRGRAAAA
ncbi:MAG: LysR family transcriptional regulator, partial [Inquilinus limosus]|nr:LysR family transcriptional regulator [Inquilinus limosus]